MTDTLTLATEHNITPARCERCHQTKDSGLSWQVLGIKDEPHYQCQACGNTQRLTRGTVLRRIRTEALDREQ